MKPAPTAAPAPAPPETGVVRLDSVELRFEQNWVLRGVTLQVPIRERLGILKPTKGSVKFKGLEVTRMGRRRLNKMRQKIGMVYQYSALISSLNVRDNIALPLEELTTKSRAEIDEIVDQKLSMVGMLDTRDKMPSELSGGMRKRIGLARALVLDPELILYDEPSAGLDPVISSVIDELIIELSEKIDTTSIIVTHEMDSAFRVATKMAMLYQGKIIETGEPEQLKQSQNPVVAQFLSGSTEGPILEGTQDAIETK